MNLVKVIISPKCGLRFGIYRQLLVFPVNIFNCSTYLMISSHLLDAEDRIGRNQFQERAEYLWRRRWEVFRGMDGCEGPKVGIEEPFSRIHAFPPRDAGVQCLHVCREQKTIVQILRQGAEVP